MDLLKALGKAAPFVQTGKDLAEDYPMQGVLVVPPEFDRDAPLVLAGDVPLPAFPGWVSAIDVESGVGVVIHLDPMLEEIPSVVLDGKQLKKLLPLLKKAPAFTLTRVGESTATFTLPTGATHHVRAYRRPDFAAIPPLPAVWTPLPWASVQTALRAQHVVAKDEEDRPDLACLHVTPWCVEASDQSRIVRAIVPGLVPEGLLLPVDLFRGWPRGCPELGVSLGRVDEWLWLQVGEELRFAKVRLDTDYPKLDPLIPEKDHGYRASVWTGALHGAVAGVRRSSPVDLIELAWSAGSVEVRGVDGDGRVLASSVVRAVGATTPVRVVLRGKHLEQAVASFLGTEQVMVFYAPSPQPLRIEDDACTELLWPLLHEDDTEVPG